jgi:hypothetical protein
MFDFLNKKQDKTLNPSQYDELFSLKSRVIRIEAEILDIMTAQNIIRNKVLKKIQFKKGDEEEEKPQDLYNGVLLRDK